MVQQVFAIISKMLRFYYLYLLKIRMILVTFLYFYDFLAKFICCNRLAHQAQPKIASALRKYFKIIEKDFTKFALICINFCFSINKYGQSIKSIQILNINIKNIEGYRWNLQMGSTFK